MSLALLAYIISVLGEVETIVSLFTWIMVVVVTSCLLLLTVFWQDLTTNHLYNIKKYSKMFVKFVFTPAIILVILLPNKDEMYVMAGLVVGEQLLTSEKGNELLDKSYDALLVRIAEATKPDKEED